MTWSQFAHDHVMKRHYRSVEDDQLHRAWYALTKRDHLDVVVAILVGMRPENRSVDPWLLLAECVPRNKIVLLGANRLGGDERVRSTSHPAHQVSNESFSSGGASEPGDQPAAPPAGHPLREGDADSLAGST